MSAPWHTILTPTQRAGAIAVIMIHHADPARIGLAQPNEHQIKLVDFQGIDQGIVLGLQEDSVLFMPHGGIAVVRAISERLTELGVPVRPRLDPIELYPEASSPIEAWCLHALSTAASTNAVDVLLEHTRRWHALGVRSVEESASVDAIEDATPLRHLIHPATVAAVGRANVGKSSLINTLVGQQVALVADVAGTTRDHVGVPVDFGGLVVRWVDTPGVDERIADTDEVTIACRVLEHADLVVHCIDSIVDDGRLDERLRAAIPAGTPCLRVGTRADRGEHGCECDLRVSVGAQTQGIAELVSRIGALLIPQTAMEDSRPWRFWSCLRESEMI